MLLIDKLHDFSISGLLGGETMLTVEQLENHNKFITGSKVAGILGLPGAYQSRYELFAQMKGYIPGNGEVTERMEAGDCMELGIAEWCKRKYGWKLLKGPKEGVFHPDYPFLYGLVDRIQIDKSCSYFTTYYDLASNKGLAVIEFKNVDKFMQKFWEDGPPEYLKSQLFFYMNVLNLPGRMVACFGGNHLEKYDLPRDLVVESFIIRKCRQFWDDLQNDRWPDPDNSESCTETLKVLYNNPSEKMEVGNQALLEVAEKRERFRLEEKKAKGEKELFENQLKETIGNNAGIVFDNGGKVTWNKTKPKTPVFNEKQFEIEYPDLYKRFLHLPPGHRMLRVTLKGER